MKLQHLISLAIIVAVLLGGAYITSQVGQGQTSAADEVLSPEASVFWATPDQKLILLLVVVGVIVATFGAAVVMAPDLTASPGPWLCPRAAVSFRRRMI